LQAKVTSVLEDEEVMVRRVEGFRGGSGERRRERVGIGRVKVRV